MTHSQLIKLRKGLGLPQWRLAEIIGVNQSTICRMEKGDYPIDGPILKLLVILKTQGVPAVLAEARK